MWLESGTKVVTLYGFVCVRTIRELIRLFWISQSKVVPEPIVSREKRCDSKNVIPL